MQDYTGYTSAEVLGKPLENVIEFKNFNCEEDFTKYKPILDIVTVIDNEFRTFLEPIKKDGEFIGYSGALSMAQDGFLKALPRDYLVEVINASPLSAVVFNLDGSILYSNNAYKKMWDLSDEELDYINNKYNIFFDKQIVEQGMMPQIKGAFRGQSHQSTPFKYLFTLPAYREEQTEKWLIAHIFPINDNEGKVSFVVLSYMDVTDQYKLEEAYTESKERLQLALEAGDLGTWDWNLVTDDLNYNKQWADMLGYQLDEVNESTWENLLHPDDKERVLSSLNNVVDGKKTELDEEYRLKTKFGEWRWILDRGKVVERNDKGDPIRIAGTHVDINERKLVEEKVKESESRFRKLVENAPIGISIVVDEKVAYGNNELIRMAEAKSVNELIGLHAREFIPTDERYKIFLERQMMVMEKGENAPLYATQLKTVNGNLIDVEIVSIPTVYMGKPAMQILIHNVTETVRARMDLARSEDLLQQLFANSPMGIVLLDDDFRVNDINTGFEKIFGFKIQEIRGQSLVEYIIPAELAEEADNLNSSAMNGDKDYIETFRYSKSGEKIPVIIYALPIISGGVNIGLYGIYIDIRKRVEAEEELKTRNLELDNFVYKVSHDLRAPLASILGLINLTMLEKNDEEKDNYIGLMEKQVTKLDFFIRDILSHSKNLKLSVTSDLIDFKEIINQCFNDLSYLKDSEHVVKKILVDEGDFYGDRFRIGEIFRNLISNAIKYHNPDQEENIVRVEVMIDSSGCNLIIKDNGMGIHQDSMPHVMEMFYRGTETSDGSGIGLYIVQKAVEKMGGKILMDSKYKEGTIFEIWLPTLRNLTKE